MRGKQFPKGSFPSQSKEECEETEKEMEEFKNLCGYNRTKGSVRYLKEEE